MNRFLKNKKGVTLLEGLIAIGLLAMVSVSTFSVLLSISRRAKQPDLREDMLLSIEKTNAELQRYTGNLISLPSPCGPEGNTTDMDGNGTLAIPCKVSSACLTAGVSQPFTTQLESNNLKTKIFNLLPSGDIMSNDEADEAFEAKKITYNMTCKGTGV